MAAYDCQVAYDTDTVMATRRITKHQHTNYTEILRLLHDAFGELDALGASVYVVWLVAAYGS